VPVFVAVAIGGSLGALARYGIDRVLEQRVMALFPWSSRLFVASLYVAASLAVGVAAVALGHVVGRQL